MKILRHTDGRMPDTFPSEKLNCASGSNELKSLGLNKIQGMKINLFDIEIKCPVHSDVIFILDYPPFT